VTIYQKHVQDPPKKMCHQSPCECNNVPSSHHWSERMSISNDIYLSVPTSLDLLILDSLSFSSADFGVYLCNLNVYRSYGMMLYMSVS